MESYTVNAKSIEEISVSDNGGRIQLTLVDLELRPLIDEVGADTLLDVMDVESILDYLENRKIEEAERNADV